MITEVVWGWALAAPHLLLFPLVLVEGPLATVLAGSLVTAGAIALPWAAALTLVADLTSDSAFFVLGRFGRQGRARELLLRLGLTETRRREVEARVGRNLPGVLLGAKVVDVAAVPVMITAGLSGTGYLRFLAWNALFTVPKVGLLLALGALFGSQVARNLNPTAVGLLAAAGAGAYLLARTLVSRRARQRTVAAS